MWFCWLQADVELKLMRTLPSWRGVAAWRAAAIPASSPWMQSAEAHHGCWVGLCHLERRFQSSRYLRFRPFPLRIFSHLSLGLWSAAEQRILSPAEGHAAPSANINSGFCSLTRLILPQDTFLFLSQTAEQDWATWQHAGQQGGQYSSNQCEWVSAAQVPFVE